MCIMTFTKPLENNDNSTFNNDKRSDSLGMLVFCDPLQRKVPLAPSYMLLT